MIPTKKGRGKEEDRRGGEKADETGGGEKEKVP